MTKEAVLKVKDAEAQAQKILDDALDRSRKMIDEAEKSAAESCERFEQEITRDYKSRVEKVRQNADEIISRSKADDEKKYLFGEKKAQTYMNDAVKIILQGVMSECQ